MDLAVALMADREQVLLGVEGAPRRVSHVVDLRSVGVVTPFADAAAPGEDIGPYDSEPRMGAVFGVGPVPGVRGKGTRTGAVPLRLRWMTPYRSSSRLPSVDRVSWNPSPANFDPLKPTQFENRNIVQFQP